MKTLGNILWFLLIGLWSAVTWALLGVLWCVFIITIPFGVQCFKIAGLMLWPFGKNVSCNFGKHPIANIIWIFCGGLGLAISYVFVGVLCYITIIGIPFGKQCFKLATLSLTPFGAKIH